MLYFQVTAAKNNEKVNLIVGYNSEEEARNNLHSQGYSIIEIRETLPPEEGKREILGKNTFFFDILLSGEKKSGQIVSEDIFKAYQKLVDDLKYQVIYIYDSKEATLEEKEFSTAKVKESYWVYRKVSDPQKIAAWINEWWKNNGGKDTVWMEESVLGREILKYQSLILRICWKIETLLQNHSDVLWNKSEKLKSILSHLRQIKTITNINKLKLIGESTLMKIGEIELEIASHGLQVKKSEFFKETNLFLKELGSNKRIGSESEEFKQKFKEIITSVFTEFFQINQKKESQKDLKKIDTTSFVFYKNLRELSIYQEKLKKLNREILSVLFKDSQKRKRLLLKKKLLLQNIAIIRKRVENHRFSYSKLMKWYRYYETFISYGVRFLSDLALYILMGIGLLFLINTATEPFFWPFMDIWNSLFSLTILAFFTLFFLNKESFLITWISFGIYSFIVLLLYINF